MSNFYKILSNPVRLKILRCLSDRPKNVNELVGTCGLAQSAVSQHLTKLKDIGLLTTERDGRYVFYKLLYPEAADIASKVEKLKKEIQK